MDIDLWVSNDTDNALRVYRALQMFGAPLQGYVPSAFEKEDICFRMGIKPVCIDIITSADGLIFDKAWDNAIEVDIDGLKIHVLSKADLIINKKVAGRPKDLIDVQMLEGLKYAISSNSA
ncbi:hypothetical protein AGMMS50293_07880 [Spirochaetia bacterium]|nr:hypothetical protein AGMMS50293_07880 [Spirochaetia bacterium]